MLHLVSLADDHKPGRQGHTGGAAGETGLGRLRIDSMRARLWADVSFRPNRLARRGRGTPTCHNVMFYDTDAFQVALRGSLSKMAA